MIKVTACNFVKQGCVEKFLEVTKELVEKTNALDPGCNQYELCKDLNDPLRFIMLEEWEDQNSLDAHLKAAHFLELVPQLHDLCSKPADITVMEKVY